MFSLKTTTVHLSSSSYFVVIDMSIFFCTCFGHLVVKHQIGIFLCSLSGLMTEEVYLFLKIWPAEIKLHVNLLYANSLYQKKKKGSNHILSCDGNRLSVVSIAYSVFRLKNVQVVGRDPFLSEKRQVCDSIYILATLWDTHVQFNAIQNSRNNSYYNTLQYNSTTYYELNNKHIVGRAAILGCIRFYRYI